jgi:hypothetical protein
LSTKAEIPLGFCAAGGENLGGGNVDADCLRGWLEGLLEDFGAAVRTTVRQSIHRRMVNFALRLVEKPVGCVRFRLGYCPKPFPLSSNCTAIGWMDLLMVSRL